MDLLTADHPGVADPGYLARRRSIADASASGATLPHVDYTPVEDHVWATVTSELRPLHARLACRAYREGAAALDLPTHRVPQLHDVSARLSHLTGFGLRAVPGLVPTRTFYGALAERTFCSTQYVRHPSVPLYTPEPDVIHEIIGHANALAHPEMAELYRLAGGASLRATSDASLEFFSKVFWFTLEFGVVTECREIKAVGAGLLSSFGEIQAFRRAEVRPFDVAAMGTQTYDITHFQPVLFGAESFAHFVDATSRCFEAFDDDTPARLTRETAT